MYANDVLKKVEDYAKQHIAWRENCLNLVASENIASPSMRRMLSSESQNRYVNAYAPTLSSNWELFEKARWYEGLDHLEKIEKYCGELLKKLFHAKYADHRLLSGATAISGVFLTHSEIGDTIMTTDLIHGGHGRNWDGLAEIYGRRIEHYPFDVNEYLIDVDKTIKK